MSVSFGTKTDTMVQDYSERASHRTTTIGRNDEVDEGWDERCAVVYMRVRCAIREISGYHIKNMRGGGK